MEINRRQVLALTSLGAVAAGIGASWVGSSWWNQAPADGYLFLDEDEGLFIRAFSGAAWPQTESIPHSGEDLQLDHFFDQSLGLLGEVPRKQVRMLLHVMESATLPTNLGFFSSLALETRQETIQDWLKHLLPEIRQAALTLCILTGAGYSTHPDVSPFFAAMHGCGYGLE